MGLALKQLVNNPIVSSLQGLEWLLPIIAPAGSGFGTTVPAVTVNSTLTGNPSELYSITLRFRGVVEEKTYTGGSNDGAFWQIGGTPASDSWNVYRLTISNPSQTYYLNRGTSGQFLCYAIDYEKTLSMYGNATLSLLADPVDVGNQEIYNSSTDARSLITPISIPGITVPTQPYDGQFIRMDVISVA